MASRAGPWGGPCRGAIVEQTFPRLKKLNLADTRMTRGDLDKLLNVIETGACPSVRELMVDDLGGYRWKERIERIGISFHCFS